jgi:hypothetical protein
VNVVVIITSAAVAAARYKPLQVCSAVMAVGLSMSLGNYYFCPLEKNQTQVSE